jgi:hypothetical protein
LRDEIGDVPSPLGISEPPPSIAVVEGDVVLVPRALPLIELYSAQHLEGPSRERSLIAHGDERWSVD